MKRPKSWRPPEVTAALRSRGISELSVDNDIFIQYSVRQTVRSVYKTDKALFIDQCLYESTGGGMRGVKAACIARSSAAHFGGRYAKV